MQLANHNNRVNQCLQSFSLLPDLLKSIMNVTNENIYFWKHTMFTTSQKAGTDLIHIAKKKITYFTSEKIMEFPTEIWWFVFSFFKKKKFTCIFFGEITRYGTHCFGNLQLPPPTGPPLSSLFFHVKFYGDVLVRALASAPSLPLLERVWNQLAEHGNSFYTLHTPSHCYLTLGRKALLCSRTLMLYSYVKPVCRCSKDGKSSDGENCLSLAPNWTNPAVEEVCILRGVSSHTEEGWRSYSSGSAFG